MSAALLLFSRYEIKISFFDRVANGFEQVKNAAHGCEMRWVSEAVRCGLRVVYPLTDEAWGVRRFFVEDPGGTIVNVLAHHS